MNRFSAAAMKIPDKQSYGKRHPELAQSLSEDKFNGAESQRKEDGAVDHRAHQTACHNGPSRPFLAHRCVDHEVSQFGEEESHHGSQDQGRFGKKCGQRCADNDGVKRPANTKLGLQSVAEHQCYAGHKHAARSHDAGPNRNQTGAVGGTNRADIHHHPVHRRDG